LSEALLGKTRQQIVDEYRALTNSMDLAIAVPQPKHRVRQVVLGLRHSRFESRIMRVGLPSDAAFGILQAIGLGKLQQQSELYSKCMGFKGVASMANIKGMAKRAHVNTAKRLTERQTAADVAIAKAEVEVVVADMPVAETVMSGGADIEESAPASSSARGMTTHRDVQISALQAEWLAHGSEDELKYLDYILNAVADSSFTLDGCAQPQDKGHEGKTFEMFCRHPRAVTCMLLPVMVLALRMYTSNAFVSINGPLRAALSRAPPEALPATPAARHGACSDTTEKAPVPRKDPAAAMPQVRVSGSASGPFVCDHGQEDERAEPEPEPAITDIAPYKFPVSIFWLTHALKILRVANAAGLAGGSGGPSGGLVQHEATAPQVSWRGLAKMVVTDAFLMDGGTDHAPLSATLDQGVALAYAIGDDSRNTPTLLEIYSEDFMSRGADLAWVSMYPNECEVLFPPMVYLRPVGCRVERLPHPSDAAKTIAVLVITVQPTYGS
jgi:hypothetical protein